MGRRIMRQAAVAAHQPLLVVMAALLLLAAGALLPGAAAQETSAAPQANKTLPCIECDENPYYLIMRNITGVNISEAVEDILEEVTEVSAGELAWRSIVAALLLCMSGLFSGLTLGLCSLDVAALRVIIDADKDSVAAQRAAAIYPLRRDGNLLLCTLLFGNVGVNAALTLVLADLTSGTVGFLTSTFFIVIFGEILPQATCARYALAIGSKVTWLVRIFIVLLFVIAKPIALVLDKVLGAEIGEVHNKKELLEVVKFHQQTNVLDESQARVIEGALRFDDKTVQDVMTPLDKVYMLEEDDLLDYDTIADIYRAGHSRIPVHKTNNRGNMIGVLFTRDLILLDPDDCTPVKNAVKFFERTLHTVQSSDKLSLVMGTFKTGSTHIAKVNAINTEDPDKDPFFELVGIVTMEDIIEEIIGDEIIDETDNFVHQEDQRQRTVRTQLDPLALVGIHHGKVSPLEDGEVAMLAAYLTQCLPQMKQVPRGFDRPLTMEEVQTVIHESSVITILKREGAAEEETKKRPPHGGGAGGPSSHAARKVGAVISDPEHQDDGDDDADVSIYEYGVPTQFFTVVLEGKVEVLAGREKYRSVIGKLGLLAANAILLDETAGPDAPQTVGGPKAFVADFSAYAASGTVRVLRVSRTAVLNAFLNRRRKADREHGVEYFGNIRQMKRATGGRLSRAASLATGEGGGGAGAPALPVATTTSAATTTATTGATPGPGAEGDVAQQ